VDYWSQEIGLPATLNPLQIGCGDDLLAWYMWPFFLPQLTYETKDCLTGTAIKNSSKHQCIFSIAGDASDLSFDHDGARDGLSASRDWNPLKTAMALDHWRTFCHPKRCGNSSSPTVPLHALAHIFHTKNAIKHVFAQLSG
jgi:hypothetical protein